jgi:hypothetical protein
LALAVAAANVSWLLRDPVPGPLAEAVAQLRAWPGRSIAYQAVRLLFYIGLPFAALLFGRDALTERNLGLQPLALPSSGQASANEAVVRNWAEWATDVGWGVAAAAATFVLMVLAWWAYRRRLASADFREPSPFGRASGWVHLREAAFHEAHWAFYRGASLLALRAHLSGGYWGIWVGLGFVGLEALLNPAWRHGLSDPEAAPGKLMRVALALLSALLFWRTQNVWLAMVLHTAIAWAMSAIAAASGRAIH